MTSSDLSSGRSGREKSENKSTRKGEPSVRLVSSRHEADVPADRDADDRDAMNASQHRSDDAPPTGQEHAAETASSCAPAASTPAAPTAKAAPAPAASEPEPPVEPAMVDRSMQAQLGQQLRALFDHVASEPLPDRLVNLLRDLESKEKKG
jgi:hypothetical protein